MSQINENKPSAASSILELRGLRKAFGRTEVLRDISLSVAAGNVISIIGFVGIICPHVTKRLLGQDHRVSVPASALSGSLLLLLADTFSRSMGNGSALPVGAITSLLGAPFFLAIIFSKKGGKR